MSISLVSSTLDAETREKINKDLIIKLENTKYNMNAPPTYIIPFSDDGDTTVIPFSYGARVLRVPRPLRQEFTERRLKFEGSLRKEQLVVRDEAASILGKKGSVMISAFCGFGKCLKFGTPVMMSDGLIKQVQNIKAGDQIMGDDSTPRNVLSTCRGQEQMYRVKPTEGDPFTANMSHILSLKISSNRTVARNHDAYLTKCFNHNTHRFEQRCYTTEAEAREYVNGHNSPDVLDIQIDEYMTLPKDIQDSLLLYRVPIHFQKKDVAIDPYLLGTWLGDRIISELMTSDTDPKLIIRRIPSNYLQNDRETRLEVLAGLIDSNGYYTEEGYKIIQSDSLADDIVYLARSLGFAAYSKESCTDRCTQVDIYGEGLEDIPCRTPGKKADSYKYTKDALCVNFILEPVEERDYYGFAIDGNRRFVLGDFTVTHNTCTAVNLATAIGFRTLILVHTVPLMKQWEEAINKFCPAAVVMRVTAKSPYKPADFYIINAQNTEKKGPEFFSDVGLTIVDEAHKIMAATLSRSLQYVQPRYLIGLSATPYRPDGLDKLLTLYFGSHDKIVRKLWREHTAYKIETGVSPRLEKTVTGKLNWNVVLDSLCQDRGRNDLIVKIIMSHPTRNFMVLTKRLTQGDYLEQKLGALGVSVTSLMRDNQEYDVNARVLIGTVGKIGTGFDHPSLDALLLASDVEQYFTQYLGRVFRRKDVVPIIFDLVDNNRTLEKHYKTRAAAYIEHGGTIVKFDKRKLISASH